MDPRPSDSMVMVLVLRCRIWSISSSQNLAPSSSSSMSAPYAPRLNRSSISFLESCCWSVYRKARKQEVRIFRLATLWRCVTRTWYVIWLKTLFSYPSSSETVVPPAHALQHGFIQTQFEAGPVKHLPLVRVACDESVNLHCLVLADSVASSLSLEGEKKKWIECTCNKNRVNRIHEHSCV